MKGIIGFITAIVVLIIVVALFFPHTFGNISPNIFPNLFVSNEEQKFVGKWEASSSFEPSLKFYFYIDYFIFKRASVIYCGMSGDHIDWRVDENFPEPNELILEMPEGSLRYEYNFINNTTLSLSIGGLLTYTLKKIG